MSETPAITVRVPLGEKAYDIHIGRGILYRAGSDAREILPTARRALIVRDPNVPNEFCSVLQSSLAANGFAVHELALQASEQNKSLLAVESVIAALLSRRFERNDACFALGGGIIGDIVGFAAAIYRRGIPVIQCPTTLLSMVDASVGGKTGVNSTIGERLVKNMVGAFHQPRLVLADLASLDSLPDREYRSGLAECLKHAMIAKDLGDPSLHHDTISQIPELVRRSPDPLAAIIARNVTIKARVVCADEFETAPDHLGGRALLNLGHTFGHVIETQPGLQFNAKPYEPLHGEAVALGLVAAAAASKALWGAEGADPAILRDLVESIGLPARVSGLPSVDTLIDRMGDDKKSEGGTLRCILPIAGGGAKVVRGPRPECIQAGWREIGAWV